MTKDTVLRFRLDGVDYTLRGDMSREKMEEVVRLVEVKIAAIRALSPQYSGVRAATLAALQLAEELAQAREENEQVFAEADIGGADSQYSYNFRLPKKAGK